MPVSWYVESQNLKDQNPVHYNLQPAGAVKYLVSPLVAVESFSVGIGLLCVHLRVLDAIPIRYTRKR